ncbi:SDR family oxidoreductase [uncultured Nocardioides sp.]|uniref:SDR family oxidoreductase n=1 Tax=uncultured Nocardioides sp. TaxID=198441 RepID=UPI00262A77EE|nr:SDR family oxidoreductase [uncultured Nocardioides sp.]
MTYLVTGATGFIGRHLVETLLSGRTGDVHVLTRAASVERMERRIARWESSRVKIVVGDLTRPGLGVDEAWVAEHRGTIDHLVHVAAVYDMAADDAANDAANVGGTANALELAAALDVGCFHHVSSVAVAGDHRGRFDETMFDEGQTLTSPYHRTKFEAEKLVRTQDDVPWRVYRPAIVLGHSETGAIDKVDGPYYFFGLLKRLRDSLPGWVPLVGVDLGDTNVVPVDYVAAAMDHLMHTPDRDGEAFHLVDPEPVPVVDLVNAFCAAAGAPQFATPVDRGLLRALSVPRALRPGSWLPSFVGSRPVQAVLEQTVGRTGIPADVLAHSTFPSVFDSTRTRAALAGSGIEVPPVSSYAAELWSFWEEQLDPAVPRDRAARAELDGKYVVITGASSGIGKATAWRVARLGGVPVLVARSKDKLDDLRADIIERGGDAVVAPCDLSDLEAIDRLCEQLVAELPSVDVVVNNAGRSIRRSLKLSEDRFHDFERTMQLNYFGAIRLVMGLLPAMRPQRSGHVVNISSIGVQTHPPRFSAYVASKAALDAWSTVVASELFGNGITFTSIHMPLVKTPMIAPTKLYDRFPAISPAQAADLVVTAIVRKPHEINTALGNLGAVAHTLTPKTAFRVLYQAYKVFPDSAAAKGDVESGDRRTDSERALLSQVFRGVHW